ncbi:putative holin-like toxin [Paenibacillus larvae]|nr:putative holin-like toxin [Paenibacillus larvae]MDT2303829.1 putative holin-like toxin [Paenibacillus larvae]
MGGRLIPERGDANETFQALQLMFLFGMFILALLTFIQKNRSPSGVKDAIYLT